jgi:hypothetical protein
MVQVWMVFLKNVKFNQSIIINIYFAPYIYIFICKLIIMKKIKYLIFYQKLFILVILITKLVIMKYFYPIFMLIHP